MYVSTPRFANAISFLTKRVKNPDEDDWGKLKKVLKYLKGTLHAMKNIKTAKEEIMNSVDKADMNAEQEMAFKFYPYMATEEYRAYCKDPFREEHRSNVLRHFTYSSIDDVK